MKSQQEIEMTYNFLKQILIHHTKGMHKDDVLNVIIMSDTIGWVLDIDNVTFSESITLLGEHAKGQTNGRPN